jgi:hypothetical protein
MRGRRFAEKLATPIFRNHWRKLCLLALLKIGMTCVALASSGPTATFPIHSYMPKIWTVAANWCRARESNLKPNSILAAASATEQAKTQAGHESCR